jgi:hypothetical protein
MRQYYILLNLLLFLAAPITNLLGQVGPFSLPPKWYFGHRAGMDFTGGAPVPMSGNVWDGGSYANQEGSTTECLPNGNVLYYSNSCVLANSTNTNIGPNPLKGGGNSSSQGCLSIPNPANPSTSFFLFVTDVDASGGSNCANLTTDMGLYAYPINSAYTIGAPTQLSTHVLGEYIAASSDNANGYWILSHETDGTGSNKNFKVWHLDSTGTLNTTPTTTAGTINTVNWKYQGGIKVNKCNTRIAYFTNNGFEVRNWTASTGTIGSLIQSFSSFGSLGIAYGLEFSPDGNILYLTDYNGALYHYNIGTGAGPTVISANNTGSGSSQGPGYGNLILGPDDKIYLSNRYSPGDAGPKYLAVISNPNSTTATAVGVGFAQTGAGAFQLAASGSNYPSTAAGVITLGWHNPFLKIANTSPSPCSKFSYTYKQYYGTSIPVLANSEEWDFGEGAGWQTGLGSTPTHNYSSNNTFTVKLRVKDQLCQNFYSVQSSVNITCFLPIELSEFTAEVIGSGTQLNWITQSESNNKYFEIQRSVNGIEFVTIGTVEGAGNSNSPIRYSFTDNSPISGNNYYRLVQYDYDGHHQASKIVTVNFEPFIISIYPNPSSSDFKMKLPKGTIGQLSITDLTGKEIVSIEILGESDVLSFGQNLADGAYMVRLVSENNVATSPIFKVSK